MKHHLERFFLFDLMLFSFIVILYHNIDTNNILKPFFDSFNDYTVTKISMGYKDGLSTQSLPWFAVIFYGMTCLLSRLLPSHIWSRLVIFILCCCVTHLMFGLRMSFDAHLLMLEGLNMVLFLHWHQTHHRASLRLSYFCLGLIVLHQGMIGLGWMLSLYIFYLVAVRTTFKRMIGLIDPIGVIILLTVLVIWHHDIGSYVTPYLASLCPALGLLLSFKIDRIWHHPWIRRYRQWISGGFALSLPTGALYTSYHFQNLSDYLQLPLTNLSTSPYWVWLSLSIFGVLRSFKFRQSFWPEVTTACQIIPLVFSYVQGMHNHDHFLFKQFLTDNVVNQFMVSNHQKGSLRSRQRLRNYKKMKQDWTDRYPSETEIILQDFYGKD